MGFFDRFKREERTPEPEHKKGHRRNNRAAVRSFFDGAKTDRLTADWGATPMHADDIINRNQQALVARSRQVCANNDYGRSYLRMVKQNVVGPSGIVMQAQARNADSSLDELANQALELAWSEFSKAGNCDITGRQSLRSLMNSAAISAAKDGEFFFKKIFGRDAGRFNVSLQILDPQRCDPTLDNPKLDDGNFIRAGIEFNTYGRPVAYYFTSTDARNPDYVHGGRNYQRVPASEIIHGFMPEIVGQKRGLPWLATALWRMNMLGGFEKAALVNARAGATKSGFFEWQDGHGPDVEEEDEPMIMDAEAGTYRELPPGMKFNPNNPDYPNGEFAVFHKSMLRGVAAGLGVAYNNLASDLEGVNFSSIRQGTLDEREHWKEIQQWLIESFVQPLFDEWLPRALLVGVTIPGSGGTLRPTMIDKYRAVKWQPRRWQWVDPRADVDAAIKSKNSFLASPGQLIREQGKDPNEVWREVGRDIEQMKAAGIPDEFIWQALGMKMETGEKADEEESDS